MTIPRLRLTVKVKGQNAVSVTSSEGSFLVIGMIPGRKRQRVSILEVFLLVSCCTDKDEVCHDV